jgi:hypothetical protein
LVFCKSLAAIMGQRGSRSLMPFPHVGPEYESGRVVAHI